MRRTPVAMRIGWTPPGAHAWVPLPRTIVVRSAELVTERLVAHELAHVLQAEANPPWPLTYVWQWIRTGFSYTRMPFEVSARAAERNEAMLEWARDLIRKEHP